MKKKAMGKVFLAILFVTVLTGCSTQEEADTNENTSPNTRSVSARSSTEQEIANVEISVNNVTYTVIMEDTPTGRALVSRLPSTSMRLPASYDRDGVLKYYDMPNEVVSDPEEITTVSAGELLLDGNDRLLLFYQDTEAVGTYTRVGRIENSEGLAEAVGNDEAFFTVTRLANE